MPRRPVWFQALWVFVPEKDVMSPIPVTQPWAQRLEKTWRKENDEHPTPVGEHVFRELAESSEKLRMARTATATAREVQLGEGKEKMRKGPYISKEDHLQHLLHRNNPLSDESPQSCDVQGTPSSEPINDAPYSTTLHQPTLPTSLSSPKDSTSPNVSALLCPHLCGYHSCL